MKAFTTVTPVAFVFAPQHETSCDLETTTKEDFDHCEESNLEVTNGFTTSRKKLKAKQRLKTLTL